ncbi:MAG TPA: MMPL family transporter [Acidimicrobiales bacterium]|jgi:RND superfamily putative drug exporter
MRTFAGWCVRHRRIVLGAWAVVLILTLAIGNKVGATWSNSFTLPNTPSAQALTLLQSVAPQQSGDMEQIVFTTSGGAKVTDPAVESQINTMIAKIQALPHVTTITSPYTTVGAKDISVAKTTAFISVNLNQQQPALTSKEATRFVNTATSADGHGVKVAVSGQLAELSDKQSFGGTGPGAVLALIVLFLIFGSVFAAITPLISALFALGTAIGVIDLLSHVIKMPQFAPELVLLIGLGVGVDYALFIVTRHRQGLVAGKEPEDSIVNAVNTSGRAVLFAGIIVVIALLGMFALGVSFLYGLAVAASIGVLLTMIAALTLLPAMLGFIGPKVMSRKQKRNLAENGPRIVGADSKGFWPNWADRIRNKPILPALGAFVIIVAVALPFFSIFLGQADQGSDPAGTTTRVSYDMLSKGFGPGFTGPLELIAVVTPDQHGVIGTVSSAVARHSDVASVSPPIYIPDHHTAGDDVALLEVYAKSSPQAKSTTNLVNELRNTTLPKATAGTGVRVYTSGDTAFFIDFANVLGSKLPLFVGVVVLMSFILLAIVFRSLVIPLTAAIMNLLSIGAAFGMLVAVFQWGDLGGLFGIGSTGPIEEFLPVMMFAIIFGLSMDYQVFLVSRIHEEYVKSGDNRVAVRNGLAATGKTITAAALIMILVFGSFILGGERVIKEFGVGLAGGVLIDAVLIRMAIVPALMTMFGKANWWFPKGLDRVLPRVAIDADDLDQGPTPAPTTDRPVDPELTGSGVH